MNIIEYAKEIYVTLASYKKNGIAFIRWILSFTSVITVDDEKLTVPERYLLFENKTQFQYTQLRIHANCVSRYNITQFTEVTQSCLYTSCFDFA